MQSTPSASPASSSPLSLRMAGTTPKKGCPAAPGLAACAPGSGTIMYPPVSVCHHVSAMGHRPSPTTSWYLRPVAGGLHPTPSLQEDMPAGSLEAARGLLPHHFHASGLIGSPTEPSTRRLLRLCLCTHESPIFSRLRIAVGAV